MGSLQPSVEAQGSQLGGQLPPCLPACQLVNPHMCAGLRKEMRKPLSAYAWCCSNRADCSLQRKGTDASLRQGKDACVIQTGGAATMGHDTKSRKLGGVGVLFLISSVLVSSRDGDSMAMLAHAHWSLRSCPLPTAHFHHR